MISTTCSARASLLWLCFISQLQEASAALWVNPVQEQACLRGQQITTSSACQTAASGMGGSTWSSEGSWSDHIPGCMEGSSGGSGNGNIHFNTGGSYGSGQYGFAVCEGEELVPYVTGHGGYGATGEGGSTDKSYPTQILMPHHTIVGVHSGGYSSFFLTSAGKVFGSGYNANGELGSGDNDNKFYRIQLWSSYVVKEIYAGGHCTLFKDHIGNIYGTGYNYHGNFGLGTTTNYNSPVQLMSSYTVSEVVIGWHHIFYILSSGAVYGSGWNAYGQLGDGSSTSRSSPVLLFNSFTISKLYAGAYMSGFITTSGTVYMMGSNSDGELGDGTTTQRTSPVQVMNGHSVVDMALGHKHSMFITSSNTVYAAGQNTYGQLCDGSTTSRSSPVQVLSSYTIFNVFAHHGYHTAFITNTYALYVCGRNGNGQLGNGGTSNVVTATQVLPGYRIALVAEGHLHSIYIEKIGTATVYGSGQNYYYNLGDGTTTDRADPISIGGSVPAVGKVRVGGYTAQLITTGGKSFMTGYSWHGETSSGSQAHVNGFTGTFLQSHRVTESAMGGHHTFWFTDAGTVLGAGYNTYGALGNGGSSHVYSATTVFSGYSVIKIAPGWHHTVFLCNGGAAYSTGWNPYGALGDGSTTHRYSPVRVMSGYTVVDIEAGAYMTGFRVLGYNGVFTTGYGANGEQGTGSSSSRSSPGQILSSYNIVKLSYGHHHCVYLTSAYQVIVHGYNGHGQMGDGTKTNVFTPKQVFSGNTVMDIMVGISGYNTFVITSSRAVYGCGYNAYGNIVTGSTSSVSSFTLISGLSSYSIRSIRSGHYFHMFIDDQDVFPSTSPTTSPTLSPTASPTTSPTLNPTASPTTSPTLTPTTSPTTSPTSTPTASPTTSPTLTPTASPTTSPTLNPTASPTRSPTTSPTTINPTTTHPTDSPTVTPPSPPPPPPSPPPYFDTNVFVCPFACSTDDVDCPCGNVDCSCASCTTLEYTELSPECLQTTITYCAGTGVSEQSCDSYNNRQVAVTPVDASSGGTISGGNLPAVGGNQVSLSVPANALSASISISIGGLESEEVALPTSGSGGGGGGSSGDTSSGPTFTRMPAPLLAFTPHGTTFSTPVTVEIPYTAHLIQANDKACMLKAESTSSTEWTEYCDGLIFNNGVMTTTLTSFSVITIGVTDLTAPTIIAASVSGKRHRRGLFKVLLTVDEICSVHYVILTGGSEPPSNSQVIAGTASDGSTVWQTDPRVDTIVKQAGVLDYDTANTQLEFALKGLEAGTTYDIYFAGRDATGNEGSATSVSQDTADVDPPVITLFEGKPFKYYKRGSGEISPDYISAYDAYDGDLSGSIVVTSALNTSQTVSSVKITTTDNAGNKAIAYGMCNCLTCYTKKDRSMSAAKRANLVYVVDHSAEIAVGSQYTQTQVDDQTVVVVNSKKAGAALRAYQRAEAKKDCYCKCKATDKLSSM